nr:glutamine--tRNA ligase-like [Ipomoea batatas]
MSDLVNLLQSEEEWLGWCLHSVLVCELSSHSMLYPLKLFQADKKVCSMGVLHWDAEQSPGINPLKVEVRLFNKLFLYEICDPSHFLQLSNLLEPAELDDWLSDLNPHSKIVRPCQMHVLCFYLAMLWPETNFAISV